MAELMNCPNCGALFVKTNIRDVCEKCFKEEEVAFETVYKFIRKKKIVQRLFSRHLKEQVLLKN